MLGHGYSLLDVKSVDTERRVITGVATAPTPDRRGDVVEPAGVKFANPLPLLLYHDTQKPVGSVAFNKATKDGITFEARIPAITDPGTLKDRVDEAWQSVKNGLLKGVSIGYRVLPGGAEFIRETGGLLLKAIEVFELSLVAVPMNAETTIASIKSVDAEHWAASGREMPAIPESAGATASSRAVKATRRDRAMKTTYIEQIASFEATRVAKAAERDALMQKAADAGETLDAAQSEQYDALEADLAKVDEHLVRLRRREAENKAAAEPVTAAVVTSARHADRPVITVGSILPPGIEFARMVMCKLEAFSAMMRGEIKDVGDIAKRRYPDCPRILQHFHKAAVPAGTTTDPVWAGPLVYADTLANEFIEYLRPMTIVGKIPNLRRVPFNVRIIGQTSGGTGYWVGQGAPKPLTSFAFNATSLAWAKVAAISVITEELARFSTPSAEMLVRDALAAALIERIDIDFIDPASAGVTNVQPASITHGLTPMSPSGTTADAARHDLGQILAAFLEANADPSGLVVIMPNTLALGLSLMRNALGDSEFPGIEMNGGTLPGAIPVITSQYAANASGAGNLVIAVNAREVFLSDDGQVTVDASREASLQMLDNPTNHSGTATPTTVVSMFQTNSIALRAERFINWAKRRPDAVVYMDDVNWGSIGSP